MERYVRFFEDENALITDNGQKAIIKNVKKWLLDQNIDSDIWVKSYEDSALMTIAIEDTDEDKLKSLLDKLTQKIERMCPQLHLKFDSNKVNMEGEYELFFKSDKKPVITSNDIDAASKSILSNLQRGRADKHIKINMYGILGHLDNYILNNIEDITLFSVNESREKDFNKKYYNAKQGKDQNTYIDNLMKVKKVFYIESKKYNQMFKLPDIVFYRLQELFPNIKILEK